MKSGVQLKNRTPDLYKYRYDYFSLSAKIALTKMSVAP